METLNIYVYHPSPVDPQDGLHREKRLELHQTI